MTKPVAHASRTLPLAEKNYSQIEKEGFTIFFAVKRIHRFVHGRKLVLQMDHRPLLSIFGSKKRISTYTANRLQCWGTILSHYNYELEFLLSQRLGGGDGLSRLIPKSLIPLADTVIYALKAEKEIKDMLCNTVKEMPVTSDEIRGKAENDTFIKKMKMQVRLKEINKNIKSISAFSICDVLLYTD